MKRLPQTIAALATAVSLAIATSPARAADAGRSALHVFAAASLSDAFAEIGHQLEQQRPGLSVRINYAGSQQLAAQLEQGAVADVFASADDRWMAYVKDRGLLAAEPAWFARNRLVVIVPKSNPARIGKIQDLAKSGVKLVVGTDAVPVGHYSRLALRNLAKTPGFAPEFATRALQNVVSEEENVKGVVSKVQLGEADAGMVYRSDVTPALARYVRVFELPEGANVIATYPMALIKDGAAPDAAKAFMDLVLSADGQRILERHGLMPISAANP